MYSFPQRKGDKQTLGMQLNGLAERRVRKRSGSVHRRPAIARRTSGDFVELNSPPTLGQELPVAFIQGVETCMKRRGRDGFSKGGDMRERVKAPQLLFVFAGAPRE
eukprot:gb/GECG01000783.1/.p1 GENE.gb/GECG01000783.1/~~gb/GECG01000783.1/.p1  ORF type:complete len:106 (+),score=15.05 gb/GECG01000783.1/:1-318(+)